MCLSFTVKTRPLSQLVVSSGALTYNSYKDLKITSIQTIYESIRANNNNGDLQLQNTIENLYDSYRNKNTPYRVYFDNLKMDYKPMEKTITCKDILTDGPVKFVYFVVRNNDRIAVPDTSEPTVENEPRFKVEVNINDEDDNPNDIFKYRQKEASIWGTHDNFDYLTVVIDNDDKQWVTSNPRLDPIYYRRVITLATHGHVPKKHIYLVDFSNSKMHKDKELDINGYLNNNNNKSRTITFKFESPATNSTISLFYVMINYFNVHVDENNKLKVKNNWGDQLPSNMTPTIFNDLNSSNSMNGTDGMFASKLWYNNGISTTILGLNPQWNQNFGKFGEGKTASSKDRMTEPNIALKLAISLEGIANQNYPTTTLQSNTVFGDMGQTGTDMIDIKKGALSLINTNTIIRFNKNNQNNNLANTILSIDLQGYNHKSLFVFTGNLLPSNSFFQFNILNSDLKFTHVAFECFLTGNNNTEISKKTIDKKQYNKIRLMNTKSSDVEILAGSYIYFERVSDNLIVKMFLQSSGPLLSPILG